MKSDKKNLIINNECLLISLGAFGKNRLITNGVEFKRVLKSFYKKLNIISSDKYLHYPKLLRIIFYIKDITINLYSKNQSDIFIHMNTHMSLPIIFSPFRKNKTIITWYSHPDTSIFTKLVLKKSDTILTAAPEIKKCFPNSFLTHAIITPSRKEIKRCKLKIDSKRTLVFLGRFSKSKRIDLFLKVAIEAFENNLIDGIKIIASSHEYEVEEFVMNQLRNIKIPYKIYRNTKKRNVYSLLKSGDIYISMQSKGGVAKAMLEACAIGIEVIVANGELKKYIKTIDKRTLDNCNLIKDAIIKLKEIKNLDYDRAVSESIKRISCASDFTVKSLFKKYLKSDYYSI